MSKVATVGEDLVVWMGVFGRGVLVSLSVVLGGWLVPGVVLGAEEPPPSTGPQVVPSVLDRVFATSNLELDIDGVDDRRVDVDVAIVDSGIQLDHPDLNVFARTNCTYATWPYSGPHYECSSASPSDGDDNAEGIWHGSTAAANIAALDNDIGTVGMASGARLWSVDVAGDERYGSLPLPDPLPMPTFDLESVIAGVKWVTERADEIEVAYLPVICAAEPESFPPGTPLPLCTGTEGDDLEGEFADAVAESIAAGVVYVFSAGRDHHTDSFIPQRFPNMLTSSQVADSDGLPGSLGGSACDGSLDDHSVANSSWGTGIDIAAPGCAGSHASAQVAAAAAILASRDNPDDLADVQAIVQTIVAEGNQGWTDDSTDNTTEPLLDVGNPAVFDPVINRNFQITEPDGITPCDPYCDDTGYVGSFDIGAATCSTEFDVRIDSKGALQTTDVPALDCDEFPTSNLQACAGDAWDGQVRLQETGLPKIDLDICINQSGTWTSYHEVTVDIVNTPNSTPTRSWAQNGTATITPSGCCAFTNTYFEDHYATDNVKAVLP